MRLLCFLCWAKGYMFEMRVIHSTRLRMVQLPLFGSTSLVGWMSMWIDCWADEYLVDLNDGCHNWIEISNCSGEIFFLGNYEIRPELDRIGRFDCSSSTKWVDLGLCIENRSILGPWECREIWLSQISLYLHWDTLNFWTLNSKI